MDARGKEGFIGIDIAEATDDGLVENGGLDTRIGLGGDVGTDG